MRIKTFLLALAAVVIFAVSMMAGYATDSMPVGRMTPTGSLILLALTALETPILMFLFGPSNETIKTQQGTANR